MKSSQTSLVAAKEAYRLAEIQYKVGMLTTTELVTTQNTLLVSELNYIQAKYLTLLYIEILEFYQGNNINF
ncbi:MAG: TolC family protein [Saprospiraceae bacterium]